MFYEGDDLRACRCDYSLNEAEGPDNFIGNHAEPCRPATITEPCGPTVDCMAAGSRDFP